MKPPTLVALFLLGTLPRQAGAQQTPAPVPLPISNVARHVTAAEGITVTPATNVIAFSAGAPALTLEAIGALAVGVRLVGSLTSTPCPDERRIQLFFGIQESDDGESSYGLLFGRGVTSSLAYFAPGDGTAQQIGRIPVAAVPDAAPLRRRFSITIKAGSIEVTVDGGAPVTVPVTQPPSGLVRLSAGGGCPIRWQGLAITALP